MLIGNLVALMVGEGGIKKEIICNHHKFMYMNM